MTVPDKAAHYQTLIAQAQALLSDETDPIANAANLCALAYHQLEAVNWFGFYFWKHDMLVVGPFQGQPACVRIAMGQGVCGTAAQTRETQTVDDVHLFPGHIPCDPASRSEVVVPLVYRDRLVGVLDVDSPELARFDADDVAGLEALAQVFVRSLDASESAGARFLEPAPRPS